ncbi:MAG TPA: hypothetical protein VFO10_28315 [Oligoflexus sp.]|uniref:hypothetical protein n=1 Tax=Oligoflexus sp. TaxID=1971216 RepID=UPI002D7FC555|nr:hypothetical protein [Oligoflexus sp.]HET9241202.1 hypothetical protein [Oligoflexus sp.]
MASLLKQLMLWSILGMMGATSAMAQEEEEAAAPASEKSGEDASKAKKKDKEKKKKGPPLYYASLGLGKTLPEGFYRIRSVNKFATGNTGYDSSGKPENFGYDLTANANAVAIEYGMSDRFSFLLLLPYISKNNVAFNKKKFRESDRYKVAVDQNVTSFKEKLAAGLQAQGQCANPTACAATVDTLIANNATIPLPPVTLPTGETTTLPTAPLQNNIALLSELVTGAATPADGATGLGDVDFGIAYSLISTRTNVFALGAGIRMPFGKFEDVPTAQRPTGEGLIQLGIRMNYDYHPWAPLWLSFQNQSEIMLVEGKRKRSSLLNPNNLNKSDPTVEGGDGEPNSQTVSRKGVGQVGQFRADLGLAKLSSVLQPMAVETSLNYTLKAAEYYGETQTNPGEQRFSYSMGFKFDGLGLDRPYPAYIRVLREKFITGKNVPLATDSFTIEFALYESF